ncbi:MAG: tyrosine-type recombinase/integrase [Planctomycetes bacterium]|nr:tyrosine-type recombinase/integrase [Planctomycetota bacterium]MBI3843289.1 tyrosine-type recombinase/integrase [Planctomycetota bacterium]
MSKGKILYLPTEQARRLIAATRMDSPRDAALFLLAYRHGLRASEVGILTREDVSLRANRIRLRRLKGSQSGEHPLQEIEANAIRTYLKSRRDSLPPLFLSRNGGGVARARLDDLMKDYGRRAKLPADLRQFRVLRHSIAVHLFRAGADILFVKEWLGHRSIQNTIVYLRLVRVKKEVQVEQLFSSEQIAS